MLLLKETGTGKELIARTIHHLSPRKDKILVRVICASLPANLIESEMFGHEKGAFTGATARKIGILPLVEHFVAFYNSKFGKGLDTIPQRTVRALQQYAWPGNVRELENVIERAVIVSRGTPLELGDWFSRETDASARRLRQMTLEDVEREHITKVLELTGWRISGPHGAASILGLKRTTLQSRMDKLGIQRPV